MKFFFVTLITIFSTAAFAAPKKAAPKPATPVQTNPIYDDSFTDAVPAGTTVQQQQAAGRVRRFHLELTYTAFNNVTRMQDADPKDIGEAVTQGYSLGVVSTRGIQFAFDYGMRKASIGVTVSTNGIPFIVSWMQLGFRFLFWPSNAFSGVYFGPALGLGSAQLAGTSVASTVSGGVATGYQHQFRFGLGVGGGLDVTYALISSKYYDKSLANLLLLGHVDVAFSL